MTDEEYENYSVSVFEFASLACGVNQMLITGYLNRNGLVTFTAYEADGSIVMSLDELNTKNINNDYKLEFE